MKLRTTLLFSLLVIFFTSLAQTNNENDRYEEAILHLNLLNRIKAYEILTDIVKNDPNHFQRKDEAKEHYQKVIGLNNTDYNLAALELSKIYIEEKKLDSALVLIDNIVKIDTLNDNAYYQRGKIKLANKEYESAKKDLNRAISINSNENLYFYERGLSLVETKNWNYAINDFNKVIETVKTTPELENAYFYRGFCHYQEGQDPIYKGHKGLFEKALEDYNTCIKLDKKDEHAFFNRGEANMALGHYTDAIRDFKHAIMLNPNNYEAHYNKAMCNYHFGQENSAIKEMTDLVKQNPTFINALYQLGSWNYIAGNQKLALSYLDRVIFKEEAHADAYLLRGYVYLDMDNNKKACVDFRTADKIGDAKAHKEVEKHCSSKKGK
jgi:tetratricopeptide (TPR) repeat protein